MRRALDPGAHGLADRLLALGDVLTNLLVDVTRSLDSRLGVGAVAPFVTEFVVLGHVAGVVARGLGQFGVGLEGRALFLGPDPIMRLDQHVEDRVGGLAAGRRGARLLRLRLLPERRIRRDGEGGEEEE